MAKFRSSNTKDLGEMVHYNRSTSLGFIKEKVAETTARIRRIEWLPASLQKKAIYIQTACWPLALYSSDTTYIGQQHYVALRRAVVDALAGHWHTASPLLACTMLSNVLIDPFLHTLCTVARTIRRLANVDLQAATQTVRFAVDFTGSRAFGPASTFRLYLDQVGWSIFGDSTIQGPEHLSCNLLVDSTKFIVNTYKKMWEVYLRDTMDRKGMGDFVINTSLARNVFVKLADEEQQLLSLNVVGGFQTEKKKASWDHKVDGKCPICGMDDDSNHRFLECPAFQNIREEHAASCTMIREVRKEWVHLPLPRHHQQITLLRAFLQMTKPPEVPMPKLPTVGRTFRFFTDGGARFPTCPEARLATWSVIQDLSGQDTERRQVVDSLFTANPIFAYFHTSAVGVVQGYQTVSRAELFAVLFAVKMTCMLSEEVIAEFVTDARYVCCIISLIETGNYKPILHKLPNADLIQELAIHWRPNTFRIKKIKSHQKFEDARSLEELWYIAGNYCADLAATSAFHIFPHCVRDLSANIYQFVQAEKMRLQQFFQYVACLNRERTRACADIKKNNADHNRNMNIPKQHDGNQEGLFPKDAMGQDAVDFAVHFAPHDFTSFGVFQIPDDTFAACLQGQNLGRAFVRWAELICWPPDVYQADKTDWGMSWLELLFSFYITTGYNIPIKRDGAGAKATYIEYTSDEAALLPKTKRAASLQILSFRNLLQNLLTITDTPFFPVFGESKCRSLQRMGHVCPVAGVPRRPTIPNQEQTILAVRQYIVALKGSAALHDVIFIRNLTPTLQLERIHETPSEQRWNQYAKLMRAKRKSRLGGA